MSDWGRWEKVGSHLRQRTRKDGLWLEMNCRVCKATTSFSKMNPNIGKNTHAWIIRHMHDK